MILGIQIIGILFGLFMAYFIFLHYKRKEFGRSQFIIWQTIWIGFVFAVIFPNLLGTLISELGIVRAMDFFTIFGFMFLTILTVNNYFTVNKINKKLEENTRKEALKNINNKNIS
ncbi:DUF2304 domain-containing protein [Candidatus Parcubacteria bacterium]|nr:DUF2304 domain-containing protein [Candidatus Parcubacteria bacterium]